MKEFPADRKRTEPVDEPCGIFVETVEINIQKEGEPAGDDRRPDGEVKRQRLVYPGVRARFPADIPEARPERQPARREAVEDACVGCQRRCPVSGD